MFNIRVLGRDKLIAMSENNRYPRENFATVRFVSPPPLNDYRLIKTPNYIDDILIVCDDINPWSRNFRNQLACFSDKNAADILDFVEKIKDSIEVLIVACEAGVSRSAGTAAALGKIYLGTDEFIFNSERYQPNVYLYQTILKIWKKRQADGRISGMPANNHAAADVNGILG